VFKTIAHKSALILALTVLTAPVSRMYAQAAGSAPQPTVVTGGDPQPTGESQVIWILLLSSLTSL
jgi:hypothetical protein